MMIDPSGRVTRIRPRVKKQQQCFTSSHVDGFFCAPHQTHPSPKKSTKKTKLQTRRKNKLSFSNVIESTGDTLQPAPTSARRSTCSTSNSKRLRHSPLHLRFVDDKEAKTHPLPFSSRKHQSQHRRHQKPSFWYDRVLTRDDSHNTAETSTSLCSHASMMLDKYAFMSYRFPITKTTEKVILRRLKNRNIVIETNNAGEILGSIDRCSSEDQRGAIRIWPARVRGFNAYFWVFCWR